MHMQKWNNFNKQMPFFLFQPKNYEKKKEYFFFTLM